MDEIGRRKLSRCALACLIVGLVPVAFVVLQFLFTHVAYSPNRDTWEWAASLATVCGGVWGVLALIAPPAALTLGILALIRITQSKGALSGMPLAILGIVLSVAPVALLIFTIVVMSGW
jgi:hypothetical protein